MLRAIIALVLCSLAQAATFTATQTGNWASTATWGGVGPPGAGDRAIINCNCTVTIPASTSVTVGDSPVAGTAVVTVAPLSGATTPVLVNAGTLTLQGDLIVGPLQACAQGAPTYNMQGGSITQLSSPVGVSYRIGWFAANNCLPYPVIESTATSWVSPSIVQTIAGNAGDNGRINITCGCDSKLNLAYTKLVNLGSASAAAVTVGGDLILDHVLAVGSGQITQLAAFFGYQLCIDFLDIRTPSNLVSISIPGPIAPTTCNHINNSVILAASAGVSRVLLQSTGLTISNTIFGFANINFPATSNVTFKNVLWADPFGDVTSTGVFPGINSGFFWDGGGDWGNEAGFNTHVITDQTGSGINVPNAVQNLVADGSGSTPNNGDLWVSPGVHYVNRVIAVNGQGNLEDGTCANATSFGHVNHVTSENSDGGGASATIALNEFQVNGCQLSQATNILADRNFDGVCPASNAAPYIQQTGLNYDYAWLSNRKDPDAATGHTTVRPWNATTGHQGTACEVRNDNSSVFSKGTVTVTTVTDANHLILSSTASINVGDYLYYDNGCTSSCGASTHRGAFVLAIPVSGSVTIGTNEDGVAGIPAAVAGQSLVIQPDIWSSGLYGTAGKGQHEGYTDPRLINPNVSVENWDLANGGPGTRTNARTQIYQVNGWDASGNAVTPNPAYTLANWLAYVRKGVSPTDLALKGFSSDASWVATTAFVVGQSVRDPSLHLQICTKAGTSGGSAPAWNDLGGTTTDNTVTWSDQGIINNPGAIPILVYNSPGITGGGVN